MRIFLLVAGVLSLIVSVFMALVSNAHLGFFLHVILSVFVILYAVFYRKIPRKIHIIAGTLCLILICFSLFLGIYGNINTADYTEDVVIVLGAGIRGEEVGAHLARRLDTAADYLSRNPDAVVIVCGGLGAGELITEAEAMARYLIRYGISPERIIKEDRSTSTYENLTFAREILNEYFPNGFRAVLVTNDFHIYRAVSLARRAGLYVNRLGASTPLSALPANYLREMTAILNMWLFGHS